MTLLDVLDSLQELQSNETELSKTKYALITYYTQLRILAGDTPENILHTLDQTMGKAVNLRKLKFRLDEINSVGLFFKHKKSAKSAFLNIYYILFYLSFSSLKITARLNFLSYFFNLSFFDFHISVVN